MGLVDDMRDTAERLEAVEFARKGWLSDARDNHARMLAAFRSARHESTEQVASDLRGYMKELRAWKDAFGSDCDRAREVREGFVSGVRAQVGEVRQRTRELRESAQSANRERAQELAVAFRAQMSELHAFEDTFLADCGASRAVREVFVKDIREWVDGARQRTMEVRRGFEIPSFRSVWADHTQRRRGASPVGTSDAEYLENQFLGVLADAHGGMKLIEIASRLGRPWRQLTSTVSNLIESGRAVKRGPLYFAPDDAPSEVNAPAQPEGLVSTRQDPLSE